MHIASIYPIDKERFISGHNWRDKLAISVVNVQKHGKYDMKNIKIFIPNENG